MSQNPAVKALVPALIPMLLFAACGGDPELPEHADEWTRYAQNPVIEPGCPVYPGGPTAISVSDPDVLYDPLTETWRMWFAVGYFDADQFFAAIKAAESSDGFTWELDEELALDHAGATDAWDYTSTETPSVVIDPHAPAEERYRLYYSGGNINQDPLGDDYPRFQIGAAHSPDGRSFTRVSAADSPYGEDGLVLRVEDSMPAYAPGGSGSDVGIVTTGVVGDPELALVDGELLMWFTVIGLDADDGDVDGGIGLARSSDGISWTADQGNPIASVRRGPMDFTAQPSAVVLPESGYELWYNADYPTEIDHLGLGPNATIGFWRASGTSPTSFTRPSLRSIVYNPDNDLERDGFSVGVDAVLNDGTTRIYYGSLAATSHIDFADNPFDFTYVINVAVESR